MGSEGSEPLIVSSGSTIEGLRALVVELQAMVAELRSTVAELREQVATRDVRIVELEKSLSESRRGGKRQAAPFSKGDPEVEPQRPGRKPGTAHGRHGHRLPPPHAGRCSHYGSGCRQVRGRASLTWGSP